MSTPEVPLSIDEQVTYFRMEMDHYDSRLPFGWADGIVSVASESQGKPQHLRENDDLVRRICNPFNKPSTTPSQSPESGTRS